MIRPVMANADGSDDELIEWVWLLERLRAASPKMVRRVVRLVRLMVEGEEIISAADRQLVLRSERPTKQYQA